MQPSRIALVLLSLGLLPLLIDGLGRVLRWWDDSTLPYVLLGVAAFDIAVALLLFADAWWSRRQVRLHAQREQPARLSVGVGNEIVLLLENRGGAPLEIIVRDQTPTTARAAPQLLEASLPAHGWVRLVYRLLPTERGNASFGDIHVRYRSQLRLAWLDQTITAAEVVQVYPNLLEVRRFEALTRATLVRTGGYHTRRMPGAGREFSHFRDYTRDDDYRQINWKATARRAKPISAIYESEHSQDIIFCLDIGRMMAARVGKLTKLDHAINAVLMLTHVSQRFQDNLGLLVFSHEVELYLPPTKGRAQYAQFLQTLYNIKPTYSYVNYREAFQFLIARHPKRALTMVFTDLLDEVVSADYRDAVRLLRRFHLPLTLAVADVPLRTLAATTPQDVEQLYEVQVARDLLHGRAELLRSLEREGGLVVDTDPEKLTVDAVNEYLALKTGMRT